MNRFTLINVSSESAALDALKTDEAINYAALNRRRPLGGGTDLLGQIKDGLIAPETVVNLKGIAGWSGIRSAIVDSDRIAPEQIQIGALTTISEIADSDEIRQKLPALAQAAHHVGSFQIRNVGTLGGNLCQRPRCWYYRNPDIICLKKGGENCPASVGENKYHSIFGNAAPCHIVTPSNLGVALVALGGYLHVASEKGARIVAAAEFYRMPTREDPFRETTLLADELVSGISVPVRAGRSAYLQFSEKADFDWALTSAAVSLRIAEDKIANIQLVLGAVAQVPWRLSAVEKYLTGKSPTDASVLQKAAELAVADAEPLNKNGYKLALVKAAVKRVIAQALA